MTRSNMFGRSALAAVLVIASTLGAEAQSVLVSHGTIIAANGDHAPGTPTGCLLNGAGTFDLGGVDDAGNVFFRGRLAGTGVLATNERAYFVGTNRSNLALVIRAGDAVPTLSGGETLNTATGTGIGGTIRISSSGQMLWLASFSGGASTTADDSALFTGTPGNFVIAAREGDVEPGTFGATFPNLSAVTLQGTQIDPTGRIAFTCATVGAGSTTSNNAAWFGGMPGALELILRKGSALPSGHVVGALGLQLFLNASGTAFHEVTLALSSGALPVTTGSDRALLLYTPGFTPGTGTNTMLMREGDLAAGTLNATFGLVNLNTSPFSYGASPWNNNGKLLVSCMLAAGSGDTVVGVNDNILYLAQLPNPPAVVLRKGDPAPGFFGGETFGAVSTTEMVLNNNDQVAFHAQLVGGSSTAANDSTIWFGGVGSLRVIAREGDPAPGTAGASFVDMSGATSLVLNDNDQVTFTASLTGGDVIGSTNNTIMYSWESGSGLTPIVRAGDTIEVTPGVFKTVSSWSGVPLSNSDGRALTFNHASKLALRVNFTDVTSAIMSVSVPGNVGTSYCLGDGTGTACPCGNNGVPGNGCASSTLAAGGHLSAFGAAVPTLGDDTLVLTASSIAGPGLFFQGTGQAGGGLGVPFGDGLLCVSGALVRLGVVFPTGNSAAYPGGLTPNPIHVAGGTTLGDVRTYQCWYRDAFVFCSPSTYNLTQALSLTWAP